MRIIDDLPFVRSDRAVVMRNAVVTAVATDGLTCDLGTLTGVPVLNRTSVSVGAKVLVLLDRDGARVLGVYGATAGGGDTGPAGPQGPPGPEGPEGPQGPPGTDGADGATGPQGPQGVKGDTGAQGTPGTPGATGSQGPVGAQGVKGDPGTPGATGSQGPKGDKGDTGSQGTPGTPGATGSQGPQGVKGDTGATGTQGPAGATGSQGPKGDTGSTGPAGPTAVSTDAVNLATLGSDGKILVQQATLDTRYVNVTGDTMTGGLNIVGPAGADLLTTQVTGDTNKRLVINAEGPIEWGDGTAPPDTYVSRIAAKVLRANAALILDGPLYMDANADVNLYRSAADTLKTDDNFTAAGRVLIGDVGYLDPLSKLNVGGSTHTAVGNLNTYRDVIGDFKVGSTTGTLKITLPKGFVSEWVSVNIRGYDYNTGSTWEVLVGGYLYSGDPQWLAYSAAITGWAPFGANIRLGYDGTKAVILLGTTASTWSYVNYHVAEVRATGTNWGGGWASAFITDESALTKIVAVNTVMTPLPATAVSPPVAAAGVVGTATTYARQDHVHVGLDQASADTRYVNTTGDNMSGLLAISAGADTAFGLTVKPDAAAFARFAVRNDGIIYIGSGTGPADASISRVGVGLLATGDFQANSLVSATKVTAGNQPAAAADLTRKDYVDTKVATYGVIFAGHPAAPLTNTTDTLVSTNVVTVNVGPFVFDANGVTIPVKGIYSVRFRALVTHTAVAQCQLYVKTAAGAFIAYGSDVVQANTNVTMDAEASAFALNAGDVIKCTMTYVGTMNPTSGGAFGTELTLVLLAAT